jgi:hypothetical protein
MKKQSHGYNPDRQDVASVTPFPGQSLEGSKPRGLHDQNRSQPTHLKKGAAESRTAKPVEVPRREQPMTSTGSNSLQSERSQQGSSGLNETVQKTSRRHIA